MSENMNEVIEETVQESEVITVPIDDTLSNSGDAADAKAVGDALALKADKSELQTAVKVNGQSADNQGLIIVTAADTKMSGTDNTTVKAKIEAVDGKTAADIKVSSDPNAQTVAQALSSGATRTADAIEMSSSDQTTVKQAIDGVKGDVSNLTETVGGLQDRTAADIKYQSGSNETIKQHVDTLDSGLVKSVNEVTPDPDTGDVHLQRVPYADNLYSEDAEQVDASFLRRTTGGSGSLSDGAAWVQRMLGNRVHTGYTAESIQLTVNAMPRSTPAAITATLDKATFEAYVGSAGTYVLEYDGDDGWDHTPSAYGVTVANTPVDGDKITIVWDGENDPVMTVSAVQRTAPPAITATIDRDTFVDYVAASGTITLTYTTEWSDDPEYYGLTITNIPIAGDQIVIVYVKEVRGTITVANPTRLVGTGWNLYNHTAGYAHVVKYSNQYGYAISGTYTALAFATTPDGAQTTITPDEDGLFNVTGDGYVIVTGGNNTDTAIWTTWSDWDEGYSGSWEAYRESAVSLATLMTANFPYGLCKIGSGATAVCDEIDFVHQEAISRITRMAYSAENLAAVKAAGRGYEYDENYIYQVRASEIVTAITVDEEYQVSEHGLEFFDGSSVEIYAEILYGANLKDKLKRDVVTLSEQTLTAGQKRQVRENIGAADPNSIYIVIDGGQTALGAAVGNYVYVKNTPGITEGVYTVKTAIPADTTIDGTYLNENAPISKGIGNALNDKIPNTNVSYIWSASEMSSGSKSIALAKPLNEYAFIFVWRSYYRFVPTYDQRLIPAAFAYEVLGSTANDYQIQSPGIGIITYNRTTNTITFTATPSSGSTSGMCMIG